MDLCIIKQKMCPCIFFLKIILCVPCKHMDGNTSAVKKNQSEKRFTMNATINTLPPERTAAFKTY